MAFAERRDDPGKTAAGVAAVVVHLAFFALLVLGVSWQRRPPEGMQVELWRELPAPPVKVAPPEPPPPRPDPKPEPKPKVEPPPTPKVEAKPKPEPKPAEKPDIALEKEKQEKARREREEREKAETLKREKAETLKREQAEKAEARKREEEKERQKEKLAALERERVAREKERADLKRQVEEGVRRLEVEQQAAAAANKKLIDDYRSRIEARIKRYLSAEACKPLGSIVVPLHVALFPDGTTRNPPRTERSSGSAACDEAMLRAVLRAQPLPLPDDPVARREFAELTLNFRPND